MKSKYNWQQIEISLALMVVFILAGFLVAPHIKMGNGAPLITGFVSSELKTQELNLVITESQNYQIFTPESVNLSSLRLSGYVDGEGQAKAYLKTANGNILIYSNIVKKTANKNLITGMATAIDQEIVMVPEKTVGFNRETIAEGYELVSGPFYDTCLDSCFISEEFSKDNPLTLVFEVEPGTVLKITKLVYTLAS